MHALFLLIFSVESNEHVDLTVLQPQYRKLGPLFLMV